MMKSGNHAIISWLHRNLNGGEYIFLNNCMAWEDPIATFCQVEIDGQIFRRSQMRGMEVSRLLESFPSACRDLTISYENKIPQKQSHLSGLSKGLQSDFFCHQFVVVRRFSNWLPSISRWYRKPKRNREFDVFFQEAAILEAVSEYKNAMRLLIDPNLLPEIVRIFYDDWVSSTSYRLNLLTELGSSRTDLDLGLVQPYGQGSLFDRNALIGSDLRTTERWRFLFDKTQFGSILDTCSRDGEFVELIQSAFPEDANLLQNDP